MENGKRIIEKIVRLIVDGDETRAEVIGELVRCKDCIHGIPTRIDTVTGEFSDERYCWRHHMCHFEDYYCANGERTENAKKCKDCKNYRHWFGDNYCCADSGTVVTEDDTCPYWHGKEGCADGS